MLVVGLGNPGKKYEGTRHNVGFSVVETLVDQLGGNWIEDKKISALKSEIFIDGVKSLVIKPQTFMNRSGESVREVLKWQSFDKMVVIYDDLDFNVGILKLKKGGSSGGHKGIQDIIEKLSPDTSLKDFYRIRIGVGHPRDSQGNNNSNVSGDVSVWVLQKPKPEDKLKLDEVEKLATKVVMSLATSKEEEVRGLISRYYSEIKDRVI